MQLWMNELQKVAQEEERRLEAFEKKRMDRTQFEQLNVECPKFHRSRGEVSQ